LHACPRFDASLQVKWREGARVRCPFLENAEDLSKPLEFQYYSATLKSMSVLDPEKWPGSFWDSMVVRCPGLGMGLANLGCGVGWDGKGCVCVPGDLPPPPPPPPFSPFSPSKPLSVPWTLRVCKRFGIGV
jgi:hypothetical protein